jgi:DNA-binding NtrC family response regulator
MPSLWIVHRDPAARRALAQLAAAGEDSVLGSPSDTGFEILDAPDAVLLGLAGDLEAELEFAHRYGPRLLGSDWILLADPVDLPEARRLFDSLSAELLAWPPQPKALRRRLQRRKGRSADPLSERRARDALAATFSRYFGDLEIPELLRSLDPHLAAVPLLVRGEPGTGRSLMARYVHAFGGTTGGSFVALGCEELRSLADLVSAVGNAARAPRARAALTLCLENVNRLPVPLQRTLRDWVAIAPPAAVQRSQRVRFVATGPDDTASEDLDAGLEQALARLCVRIPPLRERQDSIPAFAIGFAEAWAEERRERPRHFADDALEALQVYPWPGNQRELEGVLARTLASHSTDPIRVDGLRFELTPTPAAAAPPIPSARVPHRAAPRPTPGRPRPPAAEDELEVYAEPEPGEEDLLGEAELAEPELEVVAEPEPGEQEAEAASVSRADGAGGSAARAPSPSPEEIGETLRRLAGAVAHAVRNPLVAIRTFAELLPEKFQDEEFRTRFAAQVVKDVTRIEQVVERLNSLANLSAPQRVAVDVAALLDGLLEERRIGMRERQLLVLKELDHSHPFAAGDPALLHDALESLLDQCLAGVPDRGDLYVASKHHQSGLRGAPSVRVLMRLRGETDGTQPEGLSPLELSLEMMVAEILIRAQGGHFHVDASDPKETVVLIDLQA